MSATSLGVVPSGECLRSEGLVWLIGSSGVLASCSHESNCPLVHAVALRCQSTATSEIVKRTVLV